MLRGLEGRRIALSSLRDDAATEERANVLRRALEQAGAQVDALKPGQGSEEDWHGARYAALVAVGGDGVGGADGTDTSGADGRLVQLTREFLVSEKPVAAIGEALSVIVEAGGAAGRTIVAMDRMRPPQDATGAGVKTVDQPIHADGCLITAQGSADIDAFAEQVVAEFSRHLEEREVDEMSEQSFPASDPPASTAVSTGHVSPDRDVDSRP